MANDPWTGARLGNNQDSPLGGSYLAEAVNELGKWTAPSFPSTAARDVAFAAWLANGNTAADGMRCYVPGIGRCLYRSGGWRLLDPQVFTSISARNAAFPSPVKGDNCICLGTQMVHDGAAWRFWLSGKAHGATDGNGFFSFPHGGGQAPVSWVIVPAYQNTDAINGVVQILSSDLPGDAGVLGCRAIRTDTYTYFTNSPMNVNWMAQF